MSKSQKREQSRKRRKSKKVVKLQKGEYVKEEDKKAKGKEEEGLDGQWSVFCSFALPSWSCDLTPYYQAREVMGHIFSPVGGRTLSPVGLLRLLRRHDEDSVLATVILVQVDETDLFRLLHIHLVATEGTGLSQANNIFLCSVLSQSGNSVLYQSMCKCFFKKKAQVKVLTSTVITGKKVLI